MSLEFAYEDRRIELENRWRLTTDKPVAVDPDRQFSLPITIMVKLTLTADSVLWLPNQQTEVTGEISILQEADEIDKYYYAYEDYPQVFQKLAQELKETIHEVKTLIAQRSTVLAWNEESIYSQPLTP